MGERDRGLTPAPPAPPWPQRAVLAAALLTLLVAAAALGPLAPRSATSAPALLTGVLEVPLMALAGAAAPAVLGALSLALAAACACRPLERRIGPAAPLLIALLVFGSAGWARLWVDGRDLAPLALAAAAFALAYGGGAAGEPAEIYRPREPAWRAVGRWLVVGLLLAELLPTHLLLAGLLLPAALAVPGDRRRVLLPALLGGFGLGLAAELSVVGPRLWSHELGLAAETFRLDPALAGRNLLGLVAGRNVGLLAGFAPLPLLLWLGRGAPGRPALAGVALAVPVLGALLLPFDFAGGWLNLSFLALYGALWHLPARPPRPWEWVATLALCAAMVWPLAVAPRAAVAERGSELVQAWPRRLLPYEGPLRQLPSRGEALLAGSGLWLRAVDGCRLLGDSDRFEIAGGGPVTIWLAAPAEVEMVALEFGPAGPSAFTAAGAEAGRTVFRPDGRVGFELLLSQPRGRHRLWFGEAPWAVHLVELRLPGWQGGGPLRFRLLAAQP